MLLLLFAALSIVFSFLCSIWEAVLLSIPPSYVQIQTREETTVGQLLQKFKADVDRPLSAVLSLNTMAHTAGAIGVGAMATQTLGDEFLGFNSETAMGVIMTLAILIFSEIIPKTLGATYWRQLVGFTVRSLDILVKILFPLVWMSQFITRLVKNDKSESVLSRADFTAMAEIGAESGVIEAHESIILRNLLRFNTVPTEDIMTPRTVVRSASENLTIQAFYEKNRELPFSRIPIFKETQDHITGFVLKDRILQAIIDGEGQQQLKDISRDILHVQTDLLLPELFSRLMEKREHIALVVGKYGGMAGIVTLEDVIETLIGSEIVDEQDKNVDMQKLARRNWEQRARKMGVIKAEEEE